MRKVIYRAAVMMTVMLIITTGIFTCVSSAREAETGDKDQKSGGGYALSGQIDLVGYSAKIYDATNGLPTSDANCVLGASDGYVWIGGYSGIIKYDGSTFERLNTHEGLTSGRALFEDAMHRVWVATNDNGVVLLDHGSSTHITYKEGLPASSIRIFTEDRDGNIFIGTTSGVCYEDSSLNLHFIDDERINKESILKLESDINGNVYGLTRSGNIFRIHNGQLVSFFSSEELGLEKITTILADPL